MSGSIKYFFDTQVISEVERGEIKQSEWDAALAYIRRSGEYWISPLTISELLWGLNNSDPSYFETHQRRVRILYAKGAKLFLDFPRYHIANILNVPYRRSPTLESDFAFSIEVLLWARSKAELETGVFMPHMHKAVRLRLDRFEREIRLLQNGFISLLSTLKGAPKAKYSIDAWAHRIQQEYELAETSSCLSVFVEGLSAAFEHEVWMRNKARNRNYDVRKHTSDLVDGQQLIYLFDPFAVIVSRDSDLRKIIKASPQRRRIMSISALIELPMKQPDCH